jgi:N-acetylmuramoyl-L-alanine amidase
MKIGNIYRIDWHLYVVLDFDDLDGIYKVQFKNLNNGALKTEMFEENMLFKYKPMNLLFKKETKYHYKFEENGIEYEFLKENIEDIIDNLINNNWPNKKCLPVHINVYEDNIQPNTYIKLINNDKGKIYYSINNGKYILYKKELLINKNCVIKAYATKEGYDNSDIIKFNFKLKNRIIKIYFSPSRQVNNKGIDQSVYSNEMEMMNLLTDKIINNLKNKNVICYRNNPELLIKDWQKEGKEKNIDFHFALHSNGSSKHNKKGMECWIHLPISKTYSLANILYNNLYSIYYDNKNQITNRGVKFAKGNLMECNDKYFKFGILLEVAYHDNLDDAKWISENIDEIAKNITKTLIEYFQL